MMITIQQCSRPILISFMRFYRVDRIFQELIEPYLPNRGLGYQVKLIINLIEMLLAQALAAERPVIVGEFKLEYLQR